MKKKQNRAENFIKKFEDQKFSFLIGFLSLFSIILFRNILESAFEGKQILGFSPINAHSFHMIFVHFPLFYISLFLTILLVFILFTKENWIKIIKVLIVGMAVITITPFIDIIISKGSGYKLTYLRGFEQFTEIHKLFNFTTDLINASWGQRIEILLVLIGGFAYVLLKTKNFLKSITASIVIYLIIFLHGVLPNTIAKIPSYLGSNILHFRTIITNGILPIDSQNYAVVFSILIILSGFFILRKCKKEIIKKIFNFKISIYIIIFLCLGTIYGIILISKYYTFIFYSPISYLIFLLAIFSFLFVNSSTFSNPSSPEFQIPITASALFAISLGPIFFLLLSLFFIVKKFVKIKWVSVIPAFIAGFSLIYHEDTFRTIIPINKYSIELRGRKSAGWCFFLNADYNKALNQYQKALSINTEDETLKRLGQCYLNLGKTKKGIETLEKINDSDYESFLTLGQAYAGKGKRNRAIEIYEKAIEKNIEPADFYIRIAQIAAQMGEEKVMIRAIEKSLLYGSPKYKIFQIKGDFFLGKGEMNKTLDMYKKALYYNPRAVTALAGIGVIYYNQGKLKLAEEQFLRALTIEPNNDAIYNNLGALYLVSNRYADAERLFKKSIRKNPNQTEAYYNLGLVYEKMGKRRDALTMFNKALEVNPSYIPARKKIEELTR